VVRTLAWRDFVPDVQRAVREPLQPDVSDRLDGDVVHAGQQALVNIKGSRTSPALNHDGGAVVDRNEHLGCRQGLPHGIRKEVEHLSVTPRHQRILLCKHDVASQVHRSSVGHGRRNGEC